MYVVSDLVLGIFAVLLRIYRTLVFGILTLLEVCIVGLHLMFLKWKIAHTYLHLSSMVVF